jgi:hypothetical protein
MNKSTCTDCGHSPIHWAASSSKCRPCAERGGERHTFRITVDIDLVVEAFGGDVDKAQHFIDAVTE